MDVQTLTVSTLQGQETPAEARVLLAGVSWQTFKALLADIGDNRACRLAYDQGILEIMAPSQEHEDPNNDCGALLSN
jgi:Uma2 family endonuclease